MGIPILDSKIEILAKWLYDDDEEKYGPKLEANGQNPEYWMSLCVDTAANVLEVLKKHGYEIVKVEQPKPLGPGHCGVKGDHEPHAHDSQSLGTFMCTGRDYDRQPGKAEAERRRKAELPKSPGTSPANI